ncbi:hypothetical protein [Cupriavidus taiwanensis]|uniref:hypothetical protein n=1 Tax=Cupriavidus taiwanensis TaxID=164546 RepID=UPI000E10247C|nr:hypothetical protein [Cupriavidus taiwanensis]SPA48401.1 protein of unknown function [Cupriavidus taiwanensis]SPC18422.1 hypothetical protein CT19431_MP30347 [Cupriavidus taiwanensis]
MFIFRRTRGLITRTGFNVYPNEVELDVNTHRSICLLTAFGQAAADGNEEVIAFVEIKSREKLDAAA